MGRIGDGDVHAAYVEFRAKESDKVLAPPCHRKAFATVTFTSMKLSPPSSTVKDASLLIVSHPVPFSTMHLLPICPRQKHLSPAPTPS